MAAKSMEDIATWLKDIKFRRQLFGGVDEAYVWQVLEKLQGEYRNMLNVVQARDDALLEDRDQKISELLQEVERLKAVTSDSIPPGTGGRQT